MQHEVSARRQALNEEAYKSVLQTLFAQSKTDAKFLLLMKKLRKELNVSTEQHQSWLHQLQVAKQTGSLNAMLGESLHGAGTGHGAGAAGPTAVNKIRSNGPAKRRRAVVMDEDDVSDNTVSAGGDSYGSLQQMGMQSQQQGWRGPGSAGGPGYQQHTAQGAGHAAYGAGGHPHDMGAAAGYGQQHHPAQHAARPQQPAGYGHPGVPAGGGASADKKKKQQQQQQQQQQPEAPQDVPPLIGFRVQRYWPSEGKWFDGVITDRRSRDGFYCITYNIGKKDESMEWFDIEAAAAIGNPQISHYQLTPEQLDMRKHSHTRAFQSSSVLNTGRSKKSGGGGDKSSSKSSNKKRSAGDM